MKLTEMIVPNVKNMPPSGIRKYFDIISEMKDVISLGIGEPDFVTPWNICEEGIYSLEKGYTHYSSNAGLIELRKEISNYVNRKYNLEYDAETEILVTVGGSEAIDLSLRALIGPGDEVIIPEPSFVAYKGCVNFTGGKAVTVDLEEKDQFKLTKEKLKSGITDKTKAVIMPFPNNPTGGVMGKEDLEQIVGILREKDVITISDELYAELTYSGKHVSIANFEGMKETTILINGFSKAFAMTGWRIGYACGPKEIIEQMKKIHQYSIMCAPTIAQRAAIEALKNGDDEVNKMGREYNRRRRVMVDGFRKAKLNCFEPLGAFYVFPSITSTGFTSDEFCEKLLLEEKVLTIPGNAFGDCGEGFIRATYANSIENIFEAMKRIQRFAAKYQKQ